MTVNFKFWNIREIRGGADSDFQFGIVFKGELQFSQLLFFSFYIDSWLYYYYYWGTYFKCAAPTYSWIYVHWLWCFTSKPIALASSALCWWIQRFERLQSVLWGDSWASSTKIEGWKIWHGCFEIRQPTQPWGFTGDVFDTMYSRNLLWSVYIDWGLKL